MKIPTGLLSELCKYAFTTIGIGYIGDRFCWKSPKPPGSGGLPQSLMSHPLLPWLSSLFLHRPGLILSPMTKTSVALVGTADKVRKAVWLEETEPKKKDSLTNLADLCFLNMDKLLQFSINKPKVVIFLGTGGFLSYLLLEPLVSNYFERRHLKSLERKIRRSSEEARLIEALSRELGQDSTSLATLVADMQTPSVKSGLSIISGDQKRQRDLLIAAMERSKK